MTEKELKRIERKIRRACVLARKQIKVMDEMKNSMCFANDTAVFADVSCPRFFIYKGSGRKVYLNADMAHWLLKRKHCITRKDFIETGYEA